MQVLLSTRTQRKTLFIVGLTTDTSSSRTCWQDWRGRGLRDGASAARSVKLEVWSELRYALSSEEVGVWSE